MAQKQGIYQTQTESQIQKLSPQQLMLVKLIELPVSDLEERVKNEVIDNIALEEGRDSLPDGEKTREEMGSSAADEENTENDDGRYGTEEADMEYGDYSSPDDIPSYLVNRKENEGTEIPIGDTRSFIEDLEAQILEYDMSEQKQLIVQYLIGSLNSNGFIDRPLPNIVDELLFSHNIDTDEKEVEDALRILQQFEPAGIGARNLQECLLIQINRMLKDKEHQTDRRRWLLKIGREIIAKEYDTWTKIADNPSDIVERVAEPLSEELGVDSKDVTAAINVISKLNPHPGRSLCEASDDRVQTVIPDFIVETDNDGHITMTLNEGELPELHVNKEYVRQLDEYMKRGSRMSRSEKEAFIYTKQKVDAARMFIESIRQRQRTLYVTMKAIIDLQREFFLTQDEETLQPMVLRDVADKSQLDISTISRVSNSKYALVDGSIYPLKHFFMRTRANAEGEEIQARKVNKLISAVIEEEDKSKPYSDEQLMEILKQKGLNISRRTVAKYRDSMGIPTAKKRAAGENTTL
ncbi:MAG: RNA polymerase factor sigma-54 [Bacteroides sp.]|nr:RNA polymerase factor sigma-54 [Roseburia sp.]MCM1346103.1 RNA polymerase factor sigma-54 [Bacteroides sp.]MCM1420738.1 RNA polymerase factor sigma-54 [Bacteroides sp.]